MPSKAWLAYHRPDHYKHLDCEEPERRPSRGQGVSYVSGPDLLAVSKDSRKGKPKLFTRRNW